MIQYTLEGKYMKVVCRICQSDVGTFESLTQKQGFACICNDCLQKLDLS